jgi:thiosulfate dehydrogenase [quinone] small subunit
MLPQSDVINEFPLHPAKPIHIGNYGVGILAPLGQNFVVKLQVPFHINPGTYIVRVYDADGQYEAYGTEFQVTVTVS